MTSIEVQKSEVVFVIKNAPKQYKLLKNMQEMLDSWCDSFTVELTIEAFKVKLDHENRSSLVTFEAILMGPTTHTGVRYTQGDVALDHLNTTIRLLGRLLDKDFIYRTMFALENPLGVDDLSLWQWEAVFNLRGGSGYIYKLPKPLPDFLIPQKSE